MEAIVSGAAARQVCEVMARSTFRVSENTPVSEVLKMFEGGASALCVHDEEDELVGMIGEDDLRAFVEAVKTLTHLMNRRFIPIGEDARIGELAELFENDEEISALPVFSRDGSIVGAISRDQVEDALENPTAPAPRTTDERARSSGTMLRPGRPTASTRMRRTLHSFRERAAAIRTARAAESFGSEVRS